MGLRSFFLQASDVGEKHRFAPTINSHFHVHQLSAIIGNGEGEQNYSHKNRQCIMGLALAALEPLTANGCAGQKQSSA